LRILLLLITLLHCTTAVCLGAYIEEEMFVVSWGSGPDEFIAYEAHDVDPGTPGDSTDDYYVGGFGPREVFVDESNNFILVSPRRHQLKGFTNTGDLLFDFSGGSPDYQPAMYKGDIGDIFVDDKKRIYLTTVWPMSYVPVIDYENITVDSLIPFIEDPDVSIYLLNWTFDEKIMLGPFKGGWLIYDGEEFTPGGSFAVLSADGLFHIAQFAEPDKAKFYFFDDPDTSGYSPNADSVILELGVENLVHVELLNSMEPTHLYLAVYYYTDFSFYEVWQFDLDYNLIDKIIPPEEPEYYSSTPKPFITANGDVYEFRTREDGLHIIRWSKE
jgi:hypothetical protein